MTPEEVLQTPEQILAMFERDTKLRWPHQRAALVKQAIHLLEEQGRLGEAQQVRWEVALFWMHRLDADKVHGGRFGPSATFDNGTQVPDPAIFTDDALAYYERRLDGTANPILRSWYADYLWERKQNHVFARKAICAYHDCYPICVANGRMVD